MRSVRNASLILTAALVFAGPVLADNDPTVQQIYAEAEAGRVEHAQQMINQVLTDHPGSSRAHFVAAELAARQGNLGVARSQLSQAEQLDPGLTKERPQAVNALKVQLGERHAGSALMLAPQPVHRSFPWAPVLLLGGLVFFVIWLVRRRAAAPVVYPGGAYSGAGVGAGPGPYGPAGYAPGYGAPMGGGLGSGIAGGLASGLAVGAGVVAGEELAHHFLDGDRHEGNVQPVYTEVPPASNSDMGGSNFGLNDTSGWDDSGGGGFGGDSGGGGDWS